MKKLTGFQRDVLYIIAGLDNPSGLLVKRELENYYEKEIHHGRLYPNLDTLVSMELIEKGEHDKRTNFYVLTQAGADAIEKRNNWEAERLDSVDSIEVNKKTESKSIY